MLGASPVLCACHKSTASQTGEAAAQTPGHVIDSMFGCQVPIPQGMNAWKTGRDFIWLSDNEATTMRNVCLYTYQGDELRPELVAAKRDSVMQRNIPGEVEGMYMHTEGRVPLRQAIVSHEGHRILRTTGMWEMEGDAMGGPFVSHSRIDSLRGRILVAEAFVYAPGRPKEEVMKRLEAELLKLKMTR